LNSINEGRAQVGIHTAWTQARISPAVIPCLNLYSAHPLSALSSIYCATCMAFKSAHKKRKDLLLFLKRLHVFICMVHAFSCVAELQLSSHKHVEAEHLNFFRFQSERVINYLVVSES